MKYRIPIMICIALFMLVSTPAAKAQFGTNDIIISEFFDDILRVNTGSVTDLYDIVPTDNISSIAVANSTTAYVVNFSEIWEIDVVGNSVTTLATISGTSPSEITMDLNGDLLVVNSSNGVERVNTTTGVITPVYDDTFFGADDIVVSAEGFIYATEFFDGLGRIDTGGTWTKLGNWDTNFFSHLDMGPDGFLYLSTTFEDGDIYRVNPTTGVGSKIADNVFTFIDDLQVDTDGTIILAGAADTDNDSLVDDVVMAIDPITGTWSVIVDENIVGDPSPPFFNPMDVELFDGVFYASAIPEPSSCVGAICGFLILVHRRRRRPTKA